MTPDTNSNSEETAVASELGRVLINRQTWMRRPTSVIGGKADMARICQYVR